MNIFDKILGALHINFLNRKNSPSQKNTAKLRSSSVQTLQQAGRNIYNVQQSESRVPMIEVAPDSSVIDFARYTEVNILTTKKSPEPLVILECFFDGIETSHSSKRLDDRDVFHFDAIKKENIKDGYEPLFSLKVRKHTGEEFLFESKLLIKLSGNRFDLTVPGDGLIKRL